MKAIISILLLFLQGVATQDVPVFEPLFSSAGVQASVTERSPEGSEVLVVRARGSFGETIVFGISLSSADEGVFVIDSSTGNITVGPNGNSRLVIQNHNATSFVFEAFAYYRSAGPTGDRAYLRVTVEVQDINDPPRFADQQETVAVTEVSNLAVDIASIPGRSYLQFESRSSSTLQQMGTFWDRGYSARISPVGFVAHRFLAVDDDLSSNGAITYSLQQISPAMIGEANFVIRAFTGDLVIAQSLDIDQTYQLLITATDEGVPPLNASLVVMVRVDPEPPIFDQLIYSATLPEFTGVAPVNVTTVLARDSNPQNPRVINYAVGSFSPDSDDVIFNVSRTSGVVTVSGTLDRETVSRFIVSVKAYEQGQHPDGSSVAAVVLHVEDVNEPPEFLSSYYSTAVSEGVQPGEILFAGITAVDQDVGSNGQLGYSIASIEAIQTLDGVRVEIVEPFFTIDPSSGVIAVNTSLEREAEMEGFHYYEITVVAADGGDPSLSSNTTIIVSVTDINDNPPVFANTSYVFLFPENEPTETGIGQFVAEDRDSGPAANLTFSLIGPFAERFLVDVVSVTLPTTSNVAQPPVITTSRLVSRVPLDREERDMYFFTLVVRDVTSRPLNASVPVVVTVLDRNDNTPEFVSANFSLTVPEDAFPSNTFVAEFNVTDVDIGMNAEVDFSLEAGQTQQFFSLLRAGPSTIQLHLAQQLDREMQDSYSFRIFATDRGSPSLVGQTEIFITVVDVNDNPPIFDQDTYTATLVENTLAGTSVVTVNATDADIGTNAEVMYFLVSDPSLVNVHNMTGEVFLIAAPDFETTMTFTAQIAAVDCGTPQQMTGIAMVVFTIIDENDNAPVFQQANYNESVPEGVSVGSLVTRLVAVDADSGSFGQVTYSILSGNEAGQFQIDNLTGIITTEAVLDREAVPGYSLVVMAADRGQPPQSSETMVMIAVSDINDNSPQFVGEPYVIQISEGFNGSVGMSVLRVPVTDADEGSNAEIRYTLTGSDADHFTVDDSGQIRVSPLGVDFETVFDTPYVLVVTARDLGFPAMLITTTINITVTDENDNQPVFIGAPYLVRVPERTNGPQAILTVVATDGDTSTNGEIEYFIVGGNVGNFRIDINTGNITLIPGIALDREASGLPHDENGNAVYTLGVTAVDRGTPAQLNYATVSILVSDINDNAPEFTVESYNIQVSEGLLIGTTILNLLAIDDDFGSNAQVVYSIVSQEPVPGYFAIDSMTGVLSVAAPLDRELQENFTLYITATDQGPGNNQANVTVRINVTDANDNQPVFSIPPGGYVANISEDAEVGSFVITVVATDLDVGRHGQITYAIMDNNTFIPFEIADPTVGLINVSGPLDREQTAEYQLVVVATDSAANQEDVLQTFARVRVIIEDVNDNVPMFGSLMYSGTVQENADLGTRVSMVPAIVATDPDVGTAAELTYSLIGPGSGHFSINTSTGVVTTNASLDFETAEVYTGLVLIVMDGGGLESNASLEITVADTNDHSPVFPLSARNLTISEDVSVGTELTVVSATDNDQGSNARVTYSLSGENLEGEFVVVDISGAIIINRELDYELRQQYVLNITATDGGTPQREGNLILTVNIQDANDNSPIITNPQPTFNITENSGIGTLVGITSATDIDSGTNSEIVYEILTGNDGGKFAIDPQTGAISTNDTIDREERDSYLLLVQARDSATFPIATRTEVTIVVDDVNDIQPFFPTSPAIRTISESTTVGTSVLTFTAMDGDLGTNAQLMYIGISSVPAIHFNVNFSTGLITTSQSLDREAIASYNITIEAIDRGSPPLRGIGTVIINISDENDNAPAFNETSYSATIAENSINGSLVATIAAIDADIGSNGQLSYSVIGGPIAIDAFEIDTVSGMITVRNPAALDFETTQLIHVQIEAQDMGSLMLSTQTLLLVSLMDENDNSPQFTMLPGDMPVVPENALVGRIVAVVGASDADQGSNAQLTYTITGGTGQGKFNLLSDGTITVAELLDYETDFVYSLVIEAADGGFPSLTGTTTITIGITDINDNAPVFTDPDAVILVAENSEVGSSITQIMAADADSGNNGRIAFSTVATSESMPFSIDSSGDLLVAGLLDRETVPQYLVLIEARDNGIPPMSTRRQFTVTVTDVDDNLPEFTAPPEFTISENQAILVPFGILSTTDRDIGNNTAALYYIIGGDSPNLFGVSDKLGNVFLRSPVDFETQTMYTVLIAARSVEANTGNNCTALTCTVVNMTINVNDVNDNRPIWSQPVYDFGVDENAATGTTVGRLSATDADSGSFGTVEYRLLTASTNFTVDSDSGLLTLSRSFDKSSVSKIARFTAAASDGEFSESVAVRVHYITRENLVLLTVLQPLAEVEAGLDELRSTLANVSGAVIVIFTVESVGAITTRQVRQATTQPRTNITLFGANLTSDELLSSNNLLQILDDNIELIGQRLTVEAIVVYPVAPTTLPPVLNTQLILYIVIGVLGGLVLFLFLFFISVCCCVMWRRKRTRKKFIPGYKQRPKSTASSVSGYSMPATGALENPLWIDPYSNWSNETESSLTFTYRPAVSDEPHRESTEIRESVLYESKEYLMEHFSESEDDEDEEAKEIKPDGAEFTAAKRHHKPKHSKREEEEEEDDGGDNIPMVKPELDITFQPEEEESSDSSSEGETEEQRSSPQEGVSEQQEDEEVPTEIDLPLDFTDQDGDQVLEAAEEDSFSDPLMF